jgi:uncharacterized protein YndB with AHSA1/START domain
MTMLSDPVAAAGLVAREVRVGSRDGAPTKIVVARRRYAADRAAVWDALTDPERIPRWFLPVTGNLSVGGRYQLEGNAGGVVERCESPEQFDVTWEMGPQVSWLRVVLTEVGAGTELELVHEAHVPDELWSVYGPGAVGVGWDGALMGLGLYLTTGEPVDQGAAAEFPFTAEGRAFYRAAADGWGAAAEAAGDDPAAAREGADQSFSFYTTAPEASPEA